MSFSPTKRWIAVSPELIDDLFAALQAQFAEPAPDGALMIPTIGCHDDNLDRGTKRAADYPRTENGILLTDARRCYGLYWQSDLMAHFDLNGIEGVEELTEEQFTALLPEPEEDL